MQFGRRVRSVWAVSIFLGLTGCSSLLPSSGEIYDASSRAAVRPATATRVAENTALPALDSQTLSSIRGGFTASSGVVVNFSFREATFVNDSLVQGVIVPTFTVSPNSPAAAVITTTAAGAVLPSALTAGNTTNQVALNSSAAAVQSTINDGFTRILSSLGAGGINNAISNSANNQLIRQVITANIDVAGLPKLLEPSLAATLTSRLQAANAQFR